MYVNILGVVVAAIVSMVVGWVWYMPAVFGNAWMRAVGKRKEELTGAGPAMGGMFVAALVMAYVLALFIGYTAASTVMEGAYVGFLLWLGFVAPVGIGLVLFEKRSMNLFWINALHYLVALVVMGAIIASW